MPSVNKVFLVGHVTRDLELRHIPSGTAVVDIGLAVSEKRKQGTDWIEETLFIDVTAWAKNAEAACQNLRKGSAVAIYGKLKQESWTDKNTNQKRTKIKVQADLVLPVVSQQAPPPPQESYDAPPEDANF